MTRERLPDRRGHEVVEVIHRNIGYTFGVGRYDDGRPAEVFIDAAKSGVDAQIVARDGAILLSLLLQHGCAVETIRHALSREEDGAPQGPIGLLVDDLAGIEGTA
ncbi:hypothetical protein [Xanthobacter autotrophicus]|uniref:hypothetical protein n=1 Tax=Xanthobacter autotrophicus TaxID=280 RepID=UPI00372A6BA0